MKQQLIVNKDPYSFQQEVQRLLDDNWYYVPDTFKVTNAHDGLVMAILLVKDEEEDAILAHIKQHMAAGMCQCGDLHDGPVPPPHFESPDEEHPKTNDGLTFQE